MPILIVIGIGAASSAMSMLIMKWKPVQNVSAYMGWVKTVIIKSHPWKKSNGNERRDT